MCRSCDQGGTCIFAGDQHELLLEAAQIAEAAIGCRAEFGVPFSAPDGYSREALNALDQDARYSCWVLTLRIHIPENFGILYHTTVVHFMIV